MEHTFALIEKSHQGDKEARDMLVAENIGLVWSIVKRFNGRGHEQEDLFQIGTIGLIKAIDKFDTSYEVRFSTYAVPMISGEIKRFLRDDGMVKVSRSLKENGYKIRQATQFIAHEMGREATLEELAAATELSTEDVVMALDANVEVESIYKTVYQGDGNQISLVDKLIEKRDDQEKLLNRMLLEQLLG
jgi:RNA polymerase sporulation-specific sigma factor